MFFIMTLFYILTSYLFFLILTVSMILFPNYFFLNTRLTFFMKKFLITITNLFNLNQISWKPFFTMIFFFIFFMNFSSLAPFIFSFSCLPIFCVSLGGMFWFIFFLMNFANNPQKGISHLVPEGCPVYLISFMVFIELISLFIRPITLSVRLMANITAGHLLLFLVSKFIFAAFFMVLLEIMVSVIQAFVFSLLLKLYLN